MILGCYETTSLTSLSWCNSRGVNSTHHCLYTIATADSKLDDLSDTVSDSLNDNAIPRNTKERLRILNSSFKLVNAFLPVVNSSAYSGFNALFLCAVYSI